MAKTIAPFLLLLTLTFLAPSHSSLAQDASPLDGTAFANLSLQAIAGVAAADRRGARSLLTRQIALLQANQRVSALTALIAKLRANDIATKTDVLTVLQTLSTPWSTQNTDADADFIYGLYKANADQTQKSLLDGALANAQGLYRDGIADYNATDLPTFAQAPGKLQTMSQKYPASEYAENATFYLGQYYVKAFFLQVAPVAEQLTNSNAAFESYIANAEANQFVTKNFLPAGYFFRGLNGWIAGDLTDAKKWLDLGAQKFTDNDVIYVYELFFSTDHNSVIDKFLPAKSLFTNTVKYISVTPPPLYSNAASLIVALRQ